MDDDLFGHYPGTGKVGAHVPLQGVDRVALAQGNFYIPIVSSFSRQIPPSRPSPSSRPHPKKPFSFSLISSIVRGLH